MGLSQRQRFLALPKQRQQAFIDSLTEAEAQALLSSWDGWLARPEQIAPHGDWFVWLVLAGRGFGKSRTANEWVLQRVMSGEAKRIALVARTAADVRDVLIEGQSGILAVARRLGVEAVYEPSKRRVTFPAYGAVATAYSAEQGDQLRGPEHDTAVADELASWSGKGDHDAWANLLMGLRIGKPQVIATTTPRPTATIKALLADAKTVVTRGSTYDNAANLAATFLDEVKRRYEGTRLGRQELLGEVLSDVDGALWTYSTIADSRVNEAPNLQRVVVAVDPATTANESSDYTGLSVVGLGFDGDYYVLHSEHVKVIPSAWAKRALDLLDEYDAEYIIAERNNGGLMVESTIRNVRSNAPLKTIHASTKKAARATPIATLYEQAKVHHVGEHKELEDEMIVFPIATDVNDDLVDSLVYAITELDPHDSKAGELIIFKR